MPIRPKFTKEDIRRRFDRFVEVVERRELERLKYLGELCVTHARSVPADRGFHDRTGNLRSSIGYVIYKNGVAVMDNFAEVNGPEASDRLLPCRDRRHGIRRLCRIEGTRRPCIGGSACTA